MRGCLEEGNISEGQSASEERLRWWRGGLRMDGKSNRRKGVFGNEKNVKKKEWRTGREGWMKVEEFVERRE